MGPPAALMLGLRRVGQAPDKSSWAPEVDFMKTSPFHSPKQSVHHNNTKCTEGNNIETGNKKSGTGGKPLCDHCKRLN